MSDALTLSSEQMKTLLDGMAERFAPLAAEKARDAVSAERRAFGSAPNARAARDARPPRAAQFGEAADADAGAFHGGGAASRVFFRAVLRGDELALKALCENGAGGSREGGGWLAPAGFRAEIVGRLPAAAELAPHVRTMPVAADTGHVPCLDADLAVAWGGRENEAFAERDPKIGRIAWSLKRADAMTKLSRELVADAPPSLVDFLLRHFQEALAKSRDRVIAVGDGAGEPQGIATDPRLDDAELAVSGTLDYAKLVKIEQALARRHRAGARWIMGPANVRRARGLVDANGLPIFWRDERAAGGLSLLGYPLAQQDDLPDDVILFGDLGQYLWFDREEMGVESTTVGGDAFERHQVWIKIWERADGRLAVPDAFVRAKGVTA